MDIAQFRGRFGNRFRPIYRTDESFASVQFQGVLPLLATVFGRAGVFGPEQLKDVRPFDHAHQLRIPFLTGAQGLEID